MTSTERRFTGSILRRIVSAVLMLCDHYCSNGHARTVTIKPRMVKRLIDYANSGVVGIVLREVMRTLETDGLVRMYSTSRHYTYVIECQDLPKIRQRLLQLLA